VEIQQKSPDFHISAAPTAAITSQLPKTLHILSAKTLHILSGGGF
jgi:hypothetical protein